MAGRNEGTIGAWRSEQSKVPFNLSLRKYKMSLCHFIESGWSKKRPLESSENWLRGLGDDSVGKVLAVKP